MMQTEEIIKNIHGKSKRIKRPLRFMELCGTHSESVAKHAIKDVLPENIKLVTGPGCPVCVTDQEEIDTVVGLALSGIPVVCYGDAVNVPGNLGSLEEARRHGADVRIVYDVTEAVEIKKRKKTNLVFWGLGFETTAPATAWAVRQGLNVFSSHKVFPPAMQILLSKRSIFSGLTAKNVLKIDGFIDPGHVSAIIGTEAYEQFDIPQVVAGFEAEDVLRAIDMLLDQVLAGEAKVQNEYARLVKKKGNRKALGLIKATFDVCDAKWRGLGVIKNSGLKLKKKYQKQDAEHIYRDLIEEIKKKVKPKPSACRCGEVLQGLIDPSGCPLFGKVCCPDSPQGACMVSREGACNIEYRFVE